MNPQHWQIINDIFQAAVELPDNEREAYLQQRCAGDEELRAEIESLLHCDSQADTFIAEPAMKAAAAMLADDLPKLHIEQSIAHYQVIRLLGKGGMGEIYLAQDRKLERKVALKLLHIPFTGDHQRLQHFLQEARSISTLNHPNIIIVHDINLESDEPFLVTEYIEGETLRQRLSRQPTSLEEALNVVRQIGSALEAAHRAGVVHRDIKPENVMIRPDGIVKVLDFGLAKLTGAQPRYSLAAAAGNGEESDPGRFMGTIRYMSPEQARGEEVDARADIFSLGVVLYEMVVGKPGAGQSDSALIARLLSDEPFYRYESKPDLPAGIEPIIAKATNKDRAQRYVTVGDFLHDLQTVNFSMRETDMIPAQEQSGNDLLSGIIEFFRQKTAAAFALLLVAGTLVVGTIVVARIYIPAHKPQPESRVKRANFTFSKMLGERGNLASPRHFSPDGSLLVFTKFNQRVPQIFVSQRDGDHLIKVTPDGFDARDPVFSPDGQEIAFISSTGGANGIWIVPALGGEPRQLLKVPYSTAELCAWTKSDHLYFEAQYRLFRLNIGASQAQEVLFDDVKRRFAFAVSADARQVAFAALSDGQSDIWVAPIEGGKDRKVTNDDYQNTYPVWFPDGERLAYNSKRQGNNQICIAYLDGSPPEQVTLGDSDGFVRDVSPDGHVIAFESTREDSRLFALDLASRSEKPLTSDFTFWPQLSTDGRRLLYLQIKNTTAVRNLDDAQIVMKDLSASTEASPLATGAESTFSPDGKQVAFLRRDSTTHKSDIYLMDGNGGEPRRLTTGGINWTGYNPPFNPLDRGNYGWSPDSKALVYGATRDGISNLWLSPIDGSGEIKLSGNEDARLQVAAPSFTGQGMQVAYVLRPTPKAVEEVKTWQLRLRDGETEEILYSVERPIRLLGAHDGEIFFAVLQSTSSYFSNPAEISLFRYSQKTHTVKEILKVNQAYLNTIFISNDGRQIALVRQGEDADNLYLVNVKDGAMQRLTNNRDPSLRFSNLTFAADGKSLYFSKQQTWATLNLLQEERTNSK